PGGTRHPWWAPVAHTRDGSTRSDRGPRGAGHGFEQAAEAADTLVEAQRGQRPPEDAGQLGNDWLAGLSLDARDAVDDRPLRAGDVDGVGVRLLAQRLHRLLVGAVEVQVADQLGQRQLFADRTDDLQVVRLQHAPQVVQVGLLVGGDHGDALRSE